MRSLKLSLRSLLAFVVIAALDMAMTLAAIRAADLGSYTHGEMAPEVFVLGVPLMAGLLFAYLVTMLWALCRNGECPAFLFGFEVFGWAMLFLYISCFVWTNGWSDLVPRYINCVLYAASCGLHVSVRIPPVPGTAIAAFIVSLPMLVFALIGGTLTSRFRITIVMRPRSEDGQKPAKASDSGASAISECNV